MFSKLGTKIALRKAGLGNVSLPSMPALDSWGGGGNDNANTRSKEVNGTAQQQSEGNGFQNPFANVQWGKAFSSWQTPPPPTNPVRAVPAVGERAQTHPKLKVPPVDGRPCVVLFLRFCGCPFTEKIFLQMRSLANRHPTIHFIAVSHCTKEATNAWAKQLGGAWNIDIIIDEDREIYALYGLGISNWGHVLNPRNGYNQYMLGKKEGVWGQQVGDGGCRWQVGGAYAFDDRGVVKWGGPMKSVDDQIVFEDGVKALGFGSAIENRSGVF